MGWAGRIARIEEEKCIQGFGGGSEGRSTLGRPRCKWEYDIKVDLQEVEWGGME